MGTFILWWSWVAFNAGSSYGVSGGKWPYAIRGTVNTILASYGGGFYGMVYSLCKNRGIVGPIDVINGIIAALVAINAGCYLFPTYLAILVGKK